jgi:predicted transcriptional regulator
MPSTLKQIIEELVKEKAPGPNPSFSTFHFLLALELIAEKSVGRTRLAQELGIGEGATRTLLGRLKDEGLIATSKKGCSLTEKGHEIWSKYDSTVRKVRIEKNELTFAEYSYAVLVKNSGGKVKTGIEQRDAAIMAGAKGATTMLFRDGQLIFPAFSGSVKKNFPRALGQITSLFRPKENDAVIVVSSDTVAKAENGALAAAWTLVDNE